MRFERFGIVHSPGVSPSGRRLYQVKDRELAMAYIARDPGRPWQSLSPTPPSHSLLEYDEHRSHFNVKLTLEQFEQIRSNPDVHVKNNQYTLRRETYTLSVNGKSHAGQVFVRTGWEAGVKQDLGESVYDYLAGLESEGSMKGDLCIPIGIKGNRFTIAGRPTQFSASHYRAQLDIRRVKNDTCIIEGVLAVTNQIEFNTRMLDFNDKILRMLEKQGEVQEKTGAMLTRLLKVLSSDSEPAYQSSVDDGEGFAYQ